MKEKYFNSLYVLIAILACVLAWVEWFSFSIFFRILCLLQLVVAYYVKKKYSSSFVLFLLSLIIVSIAESFIILGIMKHKVIVIMSVVVYYWLTFFLIKINSRESTLNFRFKGALPSVIAILAVGYLIFSLSEVVITDFKQAKGFALLSLISFLALSFYMAYLYVNNKTVRNTWLLATIIAIFSAQFLLPLDALYFNSKVFKTLGFIAQLATRFFIFKFLITTEDEVVPSYKKDYL